MITSKKVFAIIIIAVFGILCMLNLKEGKEENLISIVEKTYEQAMKEDIPCEQTWEIARLYDNGAKDLSEAEWDELDRKINVIADSCKSNLSNPDSPTPFRPKAKELRHDKPNGPWAGPTD